MQAARRSKKFPGECQSEADSDDVPKTRTRRLPLGNGKARKSAKFVMLKADVLRPIPSAIIRTVTTEYPGDRDSVRNTCLRMASTGR